MDNRIIVLVIAMAIVSCCGITPTLWCYSGHDCVKACAPNLVQRCTLSEIECVKPLNVTAVPASSKVE